MWEIEESRSTYGERLALQIGDVEDLYALDRINNVLSVGRQFGNALLEVEHLFGEFSCFQTRCAQQLNSVFQKHLVGVDRLS